MRFWVYSINENKKAAAKDEDWKIENYKTHRIVFVFR